MRKNNSGFTLVELCVVIMLFTILALLSGAHASFLQRMLVRCELENLYSTCYMLQRSAMMRHEPQKLTFDVANHTYQYKNTVYRLPSQVRLGVAHGVKGPPGSPNFVVTKPVTFKDNSITFHSDGVIKAGSVYLTDARKQCSYALSCAVGQVSYLRKYQYTDKWCLL